MGEQAAQHRTHSTRLTRAATAVQISMVVPKKNAYYALQTRLALQIKAWPPTSATRLSRARLLRGFVQRARLQTRPLTFPLPRGC